jgi:hypothetical protein
VGGEGAGSLEECVIELREAVGGDGEELLLELVEDRGCALPLILQRHFLGHDGEFLLQVVQQIVGGLRPQLHGSVSQAIRGLPDGVDASLGSSINVVERIEGAVEVRLGKGGSLGVEGEVVGELLVELGDDLHDDVRNVYSINRRGKYLYDDYEV